VPEMRLDHISFLVADLDAAIEKWKKILGILDPKQAEQITYGEGVEGGEHMKWATFVNPGGCAIQLFEPASEGFLKKILDRRGLWPVSALSKAVRYAVDPGAPLLHVSARVTTAPSAVPAAVTLALSPAVLTLGVPRPRGHARTPASRRRPRSGVGRRATKRWAKGTKPTLLLDSTQPPCSSRTLASRILAVAPTRTVQSGLECNVIRQVRRQLLKR